MKTRRTTIVILMFVLAVMLVTMPAFAQEKNPERNPYFGETHVHTSWSLDAFAIGNVLTTLSTPRRTN